MRPMKFRAWDKEQNKMILPEEICRLHFNKGLCFAILFWNGKMTLKFTLMQLTNLKDKNGKEDWIDDIVETKVGGFRYRRRIFQAESGAFCINLPVIGATDGEDAIMLITCEHENIGNIHSSPELLEEKK